MHMKLSGLVHAYLTVCKNHLQVYLCRNLPELMSEDFCSNVDLSRYQWIHFEVLLVILSGNEPGMV